MRRKTNGKSGKLLGTVHFVLCSFAYVHFVNFISEFPKCIERKDRQIVNHEGILSSCQEDQHGACKIKSVYQYVFRRILLQMNQISLILCCFCFVYFFIYFFFVCLFVCFCCCCFSLFFVIYFIFFFFFFFFVCLFFCFLFFVVVVFVVVVFFLFFVIVFCFFLFCFLAFFFFFFFFFFCLFVCFLFCFFFVETKNSLCTDKKENV